MILLRPVAAVAALATLSSTTLGAVETPTAAELLAASIAFHDPEGIWGTAALDLTFEEARPDGSTRKTEVGIDIGRERFVWNTTRDGHRLAGEVDATHCELRLDGRIDFSDAEREEHRLTCERVTWMRDYYTYLWGLPMKLRDPGARLVEEVSVAAFQGSSVFAVKATYDEDVGGDTWYFYFDQATSALVGYRFFHDESKNDGEYVTLVEIAVLGSLRLPKTRAWYTNESDKYLGTDTLVSRNDPDRDP